MSSSVKKIVVDPLRGAVGFFAALVAIPFIVGPVRLIRGESAKEIKPEVKTMANMSKVMYEECEHRETEARKHGWNLLHPFNWPKYAMFTKGSVLLVAFQGTKECPDFKHNAMIFFNLNDSIPLDEVKSDLWRALRIRPDITEIQVTGHSLGGARAALLAKWGKENPHLRLNISGHIFNPGSMWDLDKFLTEELWLGWLIVQLKQRFFFGGNPSFFLQASNRNLENYFAFWPSECGLGSRAWLHIMWLEMCFRQGGAKPAWWTTGQEWEACTPWTLFSTLEWLWIKVSSTQLQCEACNSRMCAVRIFGWLNMLDLKGRTLKTFRKWNNELMTEPCRAEYLAGRISRDFSAVLLCPPFKKAGVRS